MARSRAARARQRHSKKSKRRQSSSQQSGWFWFVGIGMTIVVGLIVFVLVRNGRTEKDSSSKKDSTAVVGLDLHSLVVDPKDSSRIFVGGHESVSASNDKGITWKSVEALSNADAMGWAFLSDRIFVSGHPGVNVSTDNGKTFSQDNQGLPDTDVHAIGGEGSTVYSASPGVGVFVSTDKGKTWQVRSDDSGRAFFGRILVDSTNLDHAVAADAQNGAVESTDGGRTWRQLDSGGSATWVTWDPNNKQYIIASGSSGSAVTTDGGRTWKSLRLPTGAQIVEMDPSSSQTLYSASLEGDAALISVSRDGGNSWSQL